MNIIKEHIKNGSFKHCYLLYGTESYLKHLYRDKLKKAILADEDEMNYSRFEGKTVDAAKVRQIAETLPFFAERRLLVIEESGWFKSQSDFADYIPQIPEFTYLVFVEAEVDKRNRLFKAVKDAGYASEMKEMDEKNLRLFALSIFGKEGRKLTESTLSTFLDMTGTDMQNIINEAEKVLCFTIGSSEITKDDIIAVCAGQTTSRIFLMLDAIAQKKQERALELYYDLVSLREKPLSILFLLNRHFHILLEAKLLSSEGIDSKGIASKLGVPPFTVGKYLSQTKAFSENQLKEALCYGAETEEQIKSGRMQEQIGVEMFLIYCLSH